MMGEVREREVALAGMSEPVGGEAGGWRQVSPNLFWYQDTCNVFLVRAGEHALLVDFGSGECLDRLGEIGVQAVDWVLHTHHHRDQCQGDALLNDRGIPIAVPEREAGLFAEADAFWRLRSQYDQYDMTNLGFSLPRPVKVARRLRDYETFEWRGYRFEVVPTPGHTKGSITLLGEVDGQTVAFSGDLIAGHGVVHSIHDMQWQYGMPDAVGEALHSTSVLRARGPHILLPSHGVPTEPASDALAALDTNLRGLYELQREMRMSRVWHEYPHALDQPKRQILPHLWVNPHSLANTYALLADDGRAMFFDYGFPSWDHAAGGYRFVEHSIADFQANAGFTSIDVVLPSHYHDDHLAGVPHLKERYGAKAWVFENFVDIVQNPIAYNLPCLWPQPFSADRALRDGETFEWGGYQLTAFHMPGHTWYAVGVFLELDGVRVAMTGDNMLLGSFGHLRLAGPVYRNVMPPGSVAQGAERLAEFKPDLILTGHTSALRVEPGMLDTFIKWARDLDDAHSKLVAVPAEVGFALDPYVLLFHPYRSLAQPGDSLTLSVGAINYRETVQTARVELVLPPGWSAEPQSAEAEVAAGEQASFEFTVQVPANARGRAVLCADLTLGTRRFGQLAEALVDVSD